MNIWHLGAYRSLYYHVADSDTEQSSSKMKLIKEVDEVRKERDPDEHIHPDCWTAHWLIQSL